MPTETKLLDLNEVADVVVKLAMEKFEKAMNTVDNPPLTWDELKAMEGKPVWVEVDGKWWGRFWAFVEAGNDSYINFFQKGQDYPEDLWKRDMGKTWQAYRKEKE